MSNMAGARIWLLTRDQSGRCGTDVITWDWRERIDIERLAAVILERSGGTIHITDVDTGSDEYAIVISAQQLTQDEALMAYEETTSG